MHKIWMTIFLLVLSLGGKALLAYLIYTDNLWQYFFEDMTGITLELCLYGLDAVLAVTAFAFIETKLKYIVTKLCAAVFVTAAYLAFVVAVNSFYQSLCWNVMFGWAEPHMHTIDMAALGIEAYIKTGNPKYHVIFLILLGLCGCIIFFRCIAAPIKKLLLNRIRKKENNSMRMLFYRIFLKFYGRSLTQEELDEIWGEYVEAWSARKRMQAERGSSAQTPRDENGTTNEESQC